MNRAVTLLSKRLSLFQLGKAEFHGPSSSVIVPLPLPVSRLPLQEQPESRRPAPGLHRIIPLSCPTTAGNRVLSLPTLIDNAPRVAPSWESHFTVKVDPELNKPEIQEPTTSHNTPMYAGPRALTIRRHKMRKHKRNKRIQRDWFKYQKYHREKKMRAEKEFVKRMKGHLSELHAFDPEKYIEDTISRAKREWSDELAPTGRRLYPHWSRLMSLEELYGLQQSDYIDKRAGYPDEEQKEKTKELRKKYRQEFLGIQAELEEGKEKK
ncbi:unnamed protein product, partial [Mesorhabditis spiculigera]